MNIHQQQELGPSDTPSLVKTGLAEYTEEWKPTRLGDIASFFKGSGLSKADLSLDGKRRCIHYGELFTAYGEHITNVLHGTDMEGVFFCSVHNDVLMPTSDVTPNGLATASCILVSNVIIGGDVLVIRAPKELLSGEFLAYAIKINRNQVMQLVSGTTVFHLNGRDMANFRFTVPGAREQRSIVEALSDAVGLLDALEALISKKRAIKQATMQQLLTGQTRLPGYTGEWMPTRLGDIASFFKGSGLSKADVSLDGKRRCIRYGELFTIYGERITEVIHGTDNEGVFFCSNSNDVLMPTSDVTPNGLATASCIQLPGVILGGDVLVIRVPAELLNGEFLAYAIKMNRNQVMQLVTGTTVFHLYGRDMANFRFTAPNVREQHAIATVLADMDAEIAVLERRRDKTRAIRMGMMQALLTGRVRLVEPAQATVPQYAEHHYQVFSGRDAAISGVWHAG